MGREFLLPALPLTALPSPAAVPPLVTSGMHLVALEKGPQQQQQHSTPGGTSTGRAGGVEDEAPQSHTGSWAGTSHGCLVVLPEEMPVKLHPKTPQLSPAMYRDEFLST